MDFSELGTFGLANWQRDKVVKTLKKVQSERVQQSTFGQREDIGLCKTF